MTNELNKFNQQQLSSQVFPAFIALGANIGDPIKNVLDARECIARHKDCRLIASSNLYRTAAELYLDQPDFINAVILIETSLVPEELLKLLLAIELSFARKRSIKNGPRTLDLDLLLYGDNFAQIIHTPFLTLPHPQLHLRSFVLVPLLEIMPDLTVPELGNLSGYLSKIKSAFPPFPLGNSSAIPLEHDTYLNYNQTETFA